MVDLKPYIGAIEKAKQEIGLSDPRTAFLNELINQKYMIQGALVTNQLARVDSPNDKKKGAKSGWYIYREFESDYDEGQIIGSALYGCWKEGLTYKWQSKSDRAMSTKEKLAFYAAREAMKAQHEEEKKKLQHDAAAFAFEYWQECEELKPEHPYLLKKQIQPRKGTRLAKDGRAVIPVVQGDQIISLQFIDDEGGKRFLKGGRTSGGHFKIEGDNSRIYIAEGYATADSIYQATGCTTFAAFSCHNLLDAAMTARQEYGAAVIMLAGEHGNGDKQAIQAADAVGGYAIFTPDQDCSDFNDYHIKHGIDALKKELNGQDKTVYENRKRDKAQKLPMPTGVLLDLYNYYNATSGNEQKGFAMQTALAIASIVTGRAYKTDYNNYTSLYFMCVAKSGTGKEHPKTVIENVLYSANMGHFIGGDGYTSAGAVFSALLDKPRHITVIDELGRYLEAGKDMGKGTSNQREANTKIMESFGRAHGVLRPPTYSTMTLTKDQASTVRNRLVYNPSITIIGMSTPETLFRSLDMGAIKDGFVNRFIISISDAERAIRQHKPPVPVPQRVVDWIENVVARYQGEHIPNEQSEAITLEFTQEAYEEQIKMQEYCIDKANLLDRFGMAELTGRANEIAMRIALLCALSENPMAEKISASHMEWAAKYVRAHLEETIDRLKITVSGSDFERNKKEILADLREREENGITWTDMQKNAPYSQHKQKDLKEILQALKDAELAFDESYQHPQGGRPTMKWYAEK